jgi:hypothetical protein
MNEFPRDWTRCRPRPLRKASGAHDSSGKKHLRCVCRRPSCQKNAI